MFSKSKHISKISNNIIQIIYYFSYNSIRNFNYRLSRARRVVENAFGILTQRWAIYKRTLQLCPRTTRDIVMATAVLHNFLTPDTLDPNLDISMNDSISYPLPNDIISIRDNLKDYLLRN